MIGRHLHNSCKNLLVLFLDALIEMLGQIVEQSDKPT